MGQTLLVVDDETSVLKSIRRQLADEPYELHLAASGAEGLALLETTDVHLIISDMRMPEMDGVTFLRKAAERSPHTIRMVLSGYAEVGIILDAVNQGHVWRYITKPWQPEDLKLAIRNGLDLWASEAERRRLLDALREKNAQLENMNAVLEEKVRERTWELRTRSDILHMILEDAPLDAILDGGVAAVRRMGDAEAVSLRVAFEEREAGAPLAEGAPRRLADACRRKPGLLEEDGWVAFPLEKGGIHLGELVLPRPDPWDETRRGSIESVASLLAVALSQRKLLAGSGNLMGSLDRLLGEING